MPNHVICIDFQKYDTWASHLMWPIHQQLPISLTSIVSGIVKAKKKKHIDELSLQFLYLFKSNTETDYLTLEIHVDCIGSSYD